MEPMSRIQVVVADDHAVIRVALTQTLSANPVFEVVGAARSGSELLKMLTTVACGLIVTDFTMQAFGADEDGLRLVMQLRRRFPAIPIVIFTSLTNGGILQQLCQLGVAGIVGKGENLDVLEQACIKALSKETRTFLSPGLSGHLAERGNTEEEFRDARDLSPRELEVVRLFALGWSVTEIAGQLHRSVTTVATQKSSAMRKLHIDTNANLVKYAQEQGLI
ncbi:response regulator transcription factor [Paraburkholderia sp. MMS20-SJTR3]|uniref:Response regulator transcription factor n=2 Tax=Paraburkholderia sejongensis TaxID=2886946 RepID=A0ABS8JMF8_9BURK|nr:response regulator transcription factor [Paraburkholderia sp. MMS20-SJTR3]